MDMNANQMWDRFKRFWEKIPEQLSRMIIVIILLLVAFVIVRSLLVPKNFGLYGHFRADAINDNASVEMKYAGQQICAECHDDVVDVKHAGFHKNLACEVCHGPAKQHTEEPEAGQLRIPRGRGYCPLCHEYLPARPTGFPQIISASHNPMKPCITCHNPHDPKPLHTPKECSACHAEIARTKSLSRHVYVPCRRCHEAPREHFQSPRLNLPSKPAEREFCGQCHATDADSEKGIPRIDLQTHYKRYVCWQCHYPHLPEVQ